MIVASVVVMVLVALFILLIISIITSRREFCAIRLLSLSTASECDAVGGVGVSILSLYPQSISAVVNLLWCLVRVSSTICCNILKFATLLFRVWRSGVRSIGRASGPIGG